MTGFNSKLAEEVDRVLRKHGGTNRFGQPKRLSFRAAESRMKGQVSYSTIENMAAGKANIKPENLIRFALAFGEDPNHWLGLCGYEQNWRDIAGGFPLDPDEAEIIAMWKGIPSAKRSQVKNALLSVMQAVA